MSFTNDQPSSLSQIWPIIVNVSISNSEVCNLLQKKHKVRVSDSTEENTIIFPLSSVAFLLLNLDQVMVRSEDGIERIDSVLIKRFSSRPCAFIPTHNPKECVNCMINIAKVTCKPLSQLIKERLQNLQSSTITESVVLHILSNVGLSLHECLVLHDGCHSIANIAVASEDELMDCSLDQNTAKKVISFFEKDCIKHN